MPGSLPSPSSSIGIVGREEEQRRLHDGLKGAADGVGSSWVIRAGPGMGKTQLLSWLGELGIREGFLTRRAFGIRELSPPFFVLGQLFRGSEGLRDTRGSVGETVRRSPRHSTRRGGERRATPLATLLIRLTDRLGERSQERPELLLIDDFQWADVESIHGFRFLVRNLPSLRVMLVAAYRDEGLVSRGPTETAASETLRRLRQEIQLQEVVLGPLNREAVRPLVRESLVRPLPERSIGRLAARLVEYTGGNPYFARETLREWVRRSERSAPSSRIFPSPGRSAPEDDLSMGRAPVSLSIRGIFTPRLEALETQDREFLNAAAIYGESFEPAAIGSALDLSSGETRAIVHRLSVESGLIAELEGPPRARFPHALLREVIERELSPAVRVGLAFRLASWWSRHRPDEIETLARLYREAGDIDRGLEWIRRTIDRAIEAKAFGDLRRHLRWAQELLVRQPDARERISSEYVAVLDRLREYGGLRDADLIAADLLASDPTPRARLLSEIWTTSRLINRNFRHAETRFRRVLREAGRSSLRHEPEIETQIEIARAMFLLFDGSAGEGLATVARVRRLAAPGSLAFIDEIRLRVATVWFLRSVRRWADAERELSEALHFARAYGRGHSPALAPLLANRAAILFETGRLIESLHAREEQLELARGTPDPAALAHALFHLCLSNLILGRIEEYGRTREYFVSVARRIGSASFLGFAHLLEAAYRLRRVEVEEAEAPLQVARRLFTETGLPRFAFFASTDLSLARLHRGDPALARSTVEELERQSIDPLDVELQALFLRLRGELRAFEGDASAARKDLRAVLRLARNNRMKVIEAELLAIYAGWERRFGTAAAAQRTLRRALAMYRQIGVGRRELPGLLPDSISPLLAPSVTPKSLPHRPSSERRAKGEPIARRILRYLLDEGATATMATARSVAPSSLSQRGIATGLGVDRSHFARALQRLVDRGFVTAERRAVQGGARTVHVYYLTATGEELAREFSGQTPIDVVPEEEPGAPDQPVQSVRTPGTRPAPSDEFRSEQELSPYPFSARRWGSRDAT